MRFRLYILLLTLSAIVGPIFAEETPTPAPTGPTYQLPLLLARELPPSCREHAVQRRNQFALVDVVNGIGAELIFTGDSLVEGWAPLPLSGNRKVLNRGISCDTTNGLHERLLRDVAVHKPKVAAVLIGANDLFLLDRMEPWDRARHIVTNVSSLALRLQSHGIKPVILSMLPTRVAAPGLNVESTNAQIRDINKEVQRFCRQMGAEFYDIGIPVRDRQGWLEEKYTTDGLHLNFDAYQHLNRLLEPQLKQLLEGGRSERP